MQEEWKRFCFLKSWLLINNTIIRIGLLESPTDGERTFKMRAVKFGCTFFPCEVDLPEEGSGYM